MSNKTILMKLGIDRYTLALKEWIEKKISNVSQDITGLRYDSSKQELYIINSKDEPIGNPLSVKDFVVDGMLKDVIPIEDKDGNPTGEFEFVFYAGKDKLETKTFKIDFAKYLNLYKGDGKSIELNSATKEFSVKAVDATKTTTTQVIPVAGGPLAKLFENADIKVPDFNQGDSIEDILFTLFCKEEWPKSTTPKDGTAKVTINAPSFTLTNSHTSEVYANNNPVEVGTKCELSNITISEASAKIGSYSCVEGFTYGYSDADDNTQDKTDTVINAGVKSGPSLTSENYALSVDFTNFNNKADANNIADADASNVKYGTTHLTATEGVNKVVASVTGPKATVTFAAIPSKYACSNLKKTRSGENVGEGVYHTSNEKTEQTATTTTGASNSATRYVTAYYKYFGGYTTITDIKKIDSDVVRNANDICEGWINFGTSNSIVIKNQLTTEPGRSIIFAIPSKYGFSLKNALSGSEQIGTPSWPSTKVGVTTGDITTQYTVYLYPIESEDGNLAAKDIKITK